MPLLILGLILFIAAHSTRIFTDDWRSHMLERLGEKPWKGLITVVSIAGFVLMIIGYGQARLEPVALWEPPLFTRHIAILLNLFAFLLLTAAYVPRNIIKALAIGAKMGCKQIGQMTANELASLQHILLLRDLGPSLVENEATDFNLRHTAFEMGESVEDLMRGLLFERC